MKFIGHSESDRNLTLNEVVLTASSDEVRRIAEFLRDTANRMDEMGSDYDHEHLSDHATGFETSPHLVVTRDA